MVFELLKSKNPFHFVKQVGNFIKNDSTGRNQDFISPLSALADDEASTSSLPTTSVDDLRTHFTNLNCYQLLIDWLRYTSDTERQYNVTNSYYEDNSFDRYVQLSNSIFMTNVSRFSSEQIAFLDRFAPVFIQEERCFALAICAMLLTNKDRVYYEFANAKQIPDYVDVTHLLELASYCDRGLVTDYHGLASVRPEVMSPFLEILLREKIGIDQIIALLIPLLTILDDFPALSTILHIRAKTSCALHNHLMWSCSTSTSATAKTLHYNLLSDKSIKPWFTLLHRNQLNLIENLTLISSYLQSNKKMERKEKIAELHQILELASPGFRIDGYFHYWAEIFSDLAPLPLPCSLRHSDDGTYTCPDKFEVTGFVADNVHIFKSAKAPIKITFKTPLAQQKSYIFKCGDDITQDQSIIFLLRTMNKFWEQDGLNFPMEATLYACIPTGKDTGIVEMVPNTVPLSSLTDLGDFFYTHEKASLQNYQKSLAAYCVGTFLLGIGDRHLDNILISESGNICHIDFGFVFGADPKPQFTVAPMRVTKAMAAVLPNMEDFMQDVIAGFHSCRTRATVLVNLVHLLFGDKETKYLLKNLRMDLDNYGAEDFIRQKVNFSLKSVLPTVNEEIHKLAQKMKN